MSDCHRTSIVLVIWMTLLLLGCVPQLDSEETSVVSAPTATSETAALPRLLMPTDGFVFDFPIDIVLDWEWERPLHGPEYYDIRVWREGEPHVGISWTPVSEFDLSGWLVGRPTGTYYWSVMVIAGMDGVLEKEITGESAVYHFTISNTFLPTATPTATPTVTLTPTATNTATPTSTATLFVTPTPIVYFDPFGFLTSGSGLFMNRLRVQEQLGQERDYYRTHARCEVGPDWELNTTDLDAYTASIVSWRQQFAETIGVFETVPLIVPEVHYRETLIERNGVRFEYVIFQSRYAGVDVQGYLLTPLAASPPGGYPGIVALYGTNSTPEAAAGLLPEYEDYTHNVGERIAQAGAIVFVPFTQPDLSDRMRIEFAAQIAIGQTSMGMHLQKVFSAVDLLQAEPGVNVSRIGGYGISWGGVLAMWASALDTRFAATVVSGWVRDFEHWIYRPSGVVMDDHLRFFGPSFWCRFSSERVGALLAPRHVLYEYGLLDTGLGLGDPERVTAPLDEIENLYEELGVPERFAVVAFEGEHEIDGTEAIPWLIDMLNTIE